MSWCLPLTEPLLPCCCSLLIGLRDIGSGGTIIRMTEELNTPASDEDAQ